MLTGGTRAKLNAEVLMGMGISTPNYAEQISIGSFFEQLDHLITLHQREPPHMMKEGKNANQYQ